MTATTTRKRKANIEPTTVYEDTYTTPATPTEQVRCIKQRVLADVVCVLARANGADIEARQAFNAARNLCEILFSHPQQPRPEIPKLFWDTPLGRAVGQCCGDSPDSLEKEERIETVLHLPSALRERLRLEADALNKPLSDLVAEKLGK